MPGKAAKIHLSEKQLVILTKISQSRSVPQFMSQRAKIICLAFEGQWNESIAGVVGLERHQVGLWRRRWVAAWEALTLLECSEPLRLRQAIRECLTDAPRAGCQGKTTAVQITQILALACEKLALSQRPITHWTNTELRDEVVKRNIIHKLSPRRDRPFVAINCAALSKTLLESSAAADSAMSKVPSPEPIATAREASSWPTAAHCFWTKSANAIWRPKRSC